MNLRPGSAGFISTIALVLAFGFPTAGFPGGDFVDDHSDQDKNAGPNYFGYVKDNRGAPVTDAKVSAEVKGRGTIVTHTDVVGAYKIPWLDKQINPNDIVISCSKDGFKQIRVFRRTTVGANPTAAIETECTLQLL